MKKHCCQNLLFFFCMKIVVFWISRRKNVWLTKFQSKLLAKKKRRRRKKKKKKKIQLAYWVVERQEKRLRKEPLSWKFLTEHFTISVPRNWSVNEFYADKKRRSADFYTPKLGNVWSGMGEGVLGGHASKQATLKACCQTLTASSLVARLDF